MRAELKEEIEAVWFAFAGWMDGFNPEDEQSADFMRKFYYGADWALLLVGHIIRHSENREEALREFEAVLAKFAPFAPQDRRSGHDRRKPEDK